MGALKENMLIIICSNAFARSVGGSEHDPFPDSVLKGISDHFHFQVVCRYQTMPIVYIEAQDGDLEGLPDYIEREFQGGVQIGTPGGLEMTMT
ncbi:hypothetical protein HUO14_02560 [Parasphingorhabdus flavimaris]|uniref:Uncharacterized protein n=1 Tax=Parasphingorhabdus flavimaris TaxID=266812 RepID=A0ABX2MZH4_9SPHN|nr:hypothetical protein [Parasphingorhabdus flavimaris]NVD26786.1 hypothetical protein [Parasphingorhabdus flavimaris]